MASNAVASLWPDSLIYTYYHILTALHPRYYVSYCLYITSVFINLINLVPLYCYVFRKPSSLIGLWRLVFFMRILSEFFGHDYEYKLIKSIFFSNISLALATLFFYILILIPSYIAVFQLVYGRKK